MAKQEMADIIAKNKNTTLTTMAFFDEHELELAMEQEAKNTCQGQLIGLNASATFKRILMLREVEKEMQDGKYTSDRVYAHV